MPTKVSTIDILDKGRCIRINWSDRCHRFHAIWLRDNGQSPNTRNQTNQQKLITIQAIPESTTIHSAVITTDNQLALGFNPDDWITSIDLNWLYRHGYDQFNDDSENLSGPAITTWDSGFVDHLTNADYPTINRQPEALLKWLKVIDRYGIALLSGLPDKNAAVLDVINLFGYSRQTNYGEYFEIRAEINPVNLAYTSVALESHTDNPYRDPVPGLQFFSCIENNAEGGESIVVDGFRIAEIIKKENPDWFALLCRYNAQFEYQGSTDTHLRSSKPMIECDGNGTVRHIRFNNRSCHALTDIPYQQMETYYQAYRRFGELVNDPSLEVKFKLAPGQLFVTDNTRVLHGRTGFSGAAKRWMQGAYADKDSLQSKIRILERNIG